MSALLKAIGITGSRRGLARAIGATPDALNAWLNRGVNVPLEYAIEIDRVTEGEVTWQEVAPHLAHFAKRWSGFLVANTLFHVQTTHVALSRINHDCRISPPSPVIDALSENIQHHGLKHPICVDANNRLIFGEKRLHAYEQLGKKTIPAWRLSLFDLMNGKYAQGELHHTFVMSERVAVGLAIEKLIGNRQGQRESQTLRQNFVEVKGRTDDFIAYRLNFGNRQTYNQAKKVYQLSSHELMDAVDQNRLAVSAALILTRLSLDQQKHILTRPDKEIAACVSRMRNQSRSPISINSSMEKIS